MREMVTATDISRPQSESITGISGLTHRAARVCRTVVIHGNANMRPPRQVRDMVDMPGYDRSAILAALKEGPNKTVVVILGITRKTMINSELWIFHGTVDADDLAQAGVESEDETPQASAMAVILNDRLVKVALNVLEGGEFRA